MGTPLKHSAQREVIVLTYARGLAGQAWGKRGVGERKYKYIAR